MKFEPFGLIMPIQAQGLKFEPWRVLPCFPHMAKVKFEALHTSILESHTCKASCTILAQSPLPASQNHAILAIIIT